MGLLLPHISTVYLYPDMVSITPKQEHIAKGGGKRGEISTFSKESRYRLFRLLHSIQFDTIAFVTLTYGNTFPDNGKLAKVDLKRYRTAFERKYGKIPVVWRLEFQERQAPHFHLMYLDPPYIPVTDWCNLWDRCRHAPKGEIFHNSLDLKLPKGKQDSKRIGYYLAKYIGKIDNRSSRETMTELGRVWGKWNISVPEPQKIELYPIETNRLTMELLEPAARNGFLPLSTSSYTCFGSQMGNGAYRSEVLMMITQITKRRLEIEHKIVKNSTSILV